MYEPLLLHAAELCVEHPFTHPWYVTIDHSCLTEMFHDLSYNLNQDMWIEEAHRRTHYFPEPTNYHKRILLLDAEYFYQGAALTVIGFFGNKHRHITAEILDAINQADAQLTDQFSTFADLVCYYSLLLPDGYNYANLVLLKRPEGIVAWNALPLHQHAARMLSPDFYENVRIYQGRVPAEPSSRVITLDTVKYWNFQSTPTWHAVRRFSTP